MPFTNINICRNFNQAIGTTLAKLSAQECSEVVVFNSGPASVLLFDNDYSGAQFSFLLGLSATHTIRGLTDSQSVSALSTGSSVLYYRTAFYSSIPQR